MVTPIYLPGPAQDPFTSMLPEFIMKMLIGKMQHRWETEENEKEYTRKMDLYKLQKDEMEKTTDGEYTIMLMPNGKAIKVKTKKGIDAETKREIDKEERGQKNKYREMGFEEFSKDAESEILKMAIGQSAPTPEQIPSDRSVGKTGFRRPEAPEKVEGYVDRWNQSIGKYESKKLPVEKEGKNFENAHKLRSQFIKESKDFVKIRDAFGRVQAAAKDPSAAGDLALIFNYMKILDPGSVVRESEFANAAASGALGERFKAVGRKLIAGERLSNEMRQDFLKRSRMLYSAQSKFQKRLRGKFMNLAKNYNLDPQNIVMDFYSVEDESVPSISSEAQEYINTLD